MTVEEAREVLKIKNDNLYELIKTTTNKLNFELYDTYRIAINAMKNTEFENNMSDTEKEKYVNTVHYLEMDNALALFDVNTGEDISLLCLSDKEKKEYEANVVAIDFINENYLGITDSLKKPKESKNTNEQEVISENLTIEQLKKICKDNYDDGGTVVFECWTEKQMEEYAANHNEDELYSLLSSFGEWLNKFSLCAR